WTLTKEISLLRQRLVCSTTFLAFSGKKTLTNSSLLSKQHSIHYSPSFLSPVHTCIHFAASMIYV
ncbi:hypothetical protein S245_067086, partial [Arachis hypogaea]